MLHDKPATYPTDTDILSAIPQVSRRRYGHTGGGVAARDIALVLAPEPGCYGVANEPTRRHIARRLSILARRGVVRTGHDGSSGRFYRLAVAAPTAG